MQSSKLTDPFLIFLFFFVRREVEIHEESNSYIYKLSQSRQTNIYKVKRKY